MKCTTCELEEMIAIAEEEEKSFGVDTFWCPNCGTILKEKFYYDSKRLVTHFSIPRISKDMVNRGS